MNFLSELAQELFPTAEKQQLTDPEVRGVLGVLKKTDDAVKHLEVAAESVFANLSGQNLPTMSEAAQTGTTAVDELYSQMFGQKYDQAMEVVRNAETARTASVDQSVAVAAVALDAQNSAPALMTSQEKNRKFTYQQANQQGPIINGVKPVVNDKGKEISGLHLTEPSDGSVDIEALRAYIAAIKPSDGSPDMAAQYGIPTTHDIQQSPAPVSGTLVSTHTQQLHVPDSLAGLVSESEQAWAASVVSDAQHDAKQEPYNV